MQSFRCRSTSSRGSSRRKRSPRVMCTTTGLFRRWSTKLPDPTFVLRGRSDCWRLILVCPCAPDALSPNCAHLPTGAHEPGGELASSPWLQLLVGRQWRSRGRLPQRVIGAWRRSRPRRVQDLMLAGAALRCGPGAYARNIQMLPQTQHPAPQLQPGHEL